MAALRARRSFLITVGAMAPALLGLPRLARAAAQCGAGVLVGAPMGPRQALLQEVLAPVLAPSGLVPVYQTSGALAQRTRIRAEVGARHPTLDVVVLRDLDLHAIHADGGLAPVDAQAVPRSAHLLAPLKSPSALTYAWTGLVLVYNKGKFKTPPDALAALAEPVATDAAKDQGKDDGKDNGRDHIGLLDGMAGTLAMAGALAAGKGASDLEAGRAWLATLHDPGARAYADESALAEGFRKGRVRAALVWRSTALQWKKDGLDLVSVVPREGLIPTLFQAAPVAAGPNRACAAAYLDALLDPTVQQALATRLLLTPSVDDAALPQDGPAVAFTPEELARVVQRDLDLLVRSEAGLKDFWRKTFHAE